MAIGNQDTFGFNHNISVPPLEASGTVIIGNQVSANISYSVNVAQGNQVNDAASFASPSLLGNLSGDQILLTRRLDKDELVRFGFRNPISRLTGYQPPQITTKKTSDWFDPSNFDNLTLWLDASDESTITLDGSNRVSEWRDKSGGGRHHTQSTSSRRPYYDTKINGLKAVRFESGDSGWLSYDDSDNMPHFNPPFTKIVVVRQRIINCCPYGLFNSSGSQYDCFIDEDVAGDSATEYYYIQRPTGAFGRAISSKSLVLNRTTILVQRTLSLSSRNIRQDGLQTNESTTVGSYLSGELKKSAVGAFFNVSFPTGFYHVEGEVPEVMVFNRALDDTNIEYFENKLAKKWGIIF